jgi:hypothetical protein
VDNLRGVSESNFVGTQMSLGTGSDFKVLTQEDFLPKSTAENWTIIKQNLHNAHYRVPDMTWIEKELELKPRIPLDLTPIVRTKKTIKSTKRKIADEALKWGDIAMEDFPSSPKQVCTQKEVSQWNFCHSFAPSSP